MVLAALRKQLHKPDAGDLPATKQHRRACSSALLAICASILFEQSIVSRLLYSLPHRLALCRWQDDVPESDDGDVPAQPHRFLLFAQVRVCVSAAAVLVLTSDTCMVTHLCG
jgi:hypothetical protein